jgi:hypothetical protein
MNGEIEMILDGVIAWYMSIISKFGVWGYIWLRLLWPSVACGGNILVQWAIHPSHRQAYPRSKDRTFGTWNTFDSAGFHHHSQTFTCFQSYFHSNLKIASHSNVGTHIPPHHGKEHASEYCHVSSESSVSSGLTITFGLKSSRFTYSPSNYLLQTLTASA